MTKTMKNLCMLALIAGLVLFAGDVLAQGTTTTTTPTTTGGTQAGFFSYAGKRFMQAFKSVRTMVLIFGGFGLVVLAVAAILGKVKWAALGALAAGLAIVAVAGKVVDYATKGENAVTSTSDLDSGFGDIGG